MPWEKITKSISIITIIIFLFTNITYGVPSSRSLFKNKKVDYQKLSAQSEQHLQQKKAIFQDGDKKKEQYRKQAKRILSSHLKDLTKIHIPSELGRIIEVYDASQEKSDPGRQKAEERLIVHIQDLHTNPEAELNLARILELLITDYNLGLVCSEGADGLVDTSSISSFPNYRVKEKVARIFINSGELTGEEYLSITKYPDLAIWGVEDRDIYFKNIIDFNKIMQFSPSSQVFISQTKKVLEGIKRDIYSKELMKIDEKERDYEDKKIETKEYLGYLTAYIKRFNIPTSDYRNITLLTETMQEEGKIDNLKVMQDSQNLVLNLKVQFSKMGLDKEADYLNVQAGLFKDEKISAFSFYSYLRDLALEYNLIASSDGASAKQSQSHNYPNLNNFVSYLSKLNSIDSTKLFNEMETLTYEVKQRLAKNNRQKILTKALHNIKFLEDFFNLKVSNEELDYYLKNKESHKVAWFRDAIMSLTGQLANRPTGYIDFNPALIDDHLQELEDFYRTVKKRDEAMVRNALSEIEKRDVNVDVLVAGGFHTKGITRLLREKGYSYIVVSPYSSTDIDEENYHFLLSGRRRPITELIQQLDLKGVFTRIFRTLRIPLGFSDLVYEFNRITADFFGLSREEAQAKGLSYRMARMLGIEGIGRGLKDWTDIPYSISIKSQGKDSIVAEYRYSSKEEDVSYIRIVKKDDRRYEVANVDASAFIGKEIPIGHSAVKLAEAKETSPLGLSGTGIHQGGMPILNLLEDGNFAGVVQELKIAEQNNDKKAIGGYVNSIASYLDSKNTNLIRQTLNFAISSELEVSDIAIRNELRSKILSHIYTFLAGDVLTHPEDFNRAVNNRLRGEHIIIIAEDNDEVAKVKALEGYDGMRMDILIAGKDTLKDYDVKDIRDNTFIVYGDRFKPLVGDSGVSLDKIYSLNKALARAIISGV